MSWGEIYNTSWWGVALDTARTVKARPDFFGSQLNLLTSEQPNLVTNGTFDTDSDWTLSLGATISNNLLNFDNVNDDNTRQLNLFPTPSLGTYLVSFDISNYVSGHIDLYLGGFQRFNFNADANGTWKQTCVISNPSSNDIFYFIADNFTGSIDNVSVQLVRADLDQIEAKKCLADWIHTTALKDLNN